MWQVCGTKGVPGRRDRAMIADYAADLQRSGAGDRDRTGMTSLEGCGSQGAELLPARSAPCATCRECPVRYR
jgi:hypothetical protein